MAEAPIAKYDVSVRDAALSVMLLYTRQVQIIRWLVVVSLPVSLVLCAMGILSYRAAFVALCGVMYICSQATAWTSRIRKDPLSHKGIQLTISEDFLVYRSELIDMEYRYSWSRMERIHRQLGYIIVQFGGDQPVVFPIPARAFGSDRDAQDFYDACQRHFVLARVARHNDGLCPPSRLRTRLDQALWQNIIVLSAVIAGWFFWAALPFAVALTTVLVHWPPTRYRRANLANVLITQGKSDQAIALLSPHLDKDSCNEFDCLVAANANRNLGKFQEAVDLCAKAVQRNPANGAAYYHLGHAQLMMLQVDEAIETLSKCAKMTGSLDVYLCRAAAYIYKHQYQRAIDDCNESISLFGAKHLLYHCRSYANVCMNKFEQAQMDGNEAVKLAQWEAPVTVAWTYAERGEVLMHIGKLDEALADCNKALSTYSDSDAGLMNRGQVFCRLGRFDDAAADIQKASTHNCAPYLKLLILNNLAFVEVMRQNYDVAEANMNEALSLYRSSYGVMVRGLIHARKRELPEALSLLDESIGIDEYNAESYWIRARVHGALGNAEESDADAKVAEEFGYKPFFDVLTE
jgi:tetratricopeptide (TPR) repeat protein